MRTEFEAVASTLQTYFDGLYESDTKRLRQVFHPDAIYACATEGNLLKLTMAEYFPIVDKRPSPASRNDPRADKILEIQFAGSVTAFARVECAIAPKSFIDFLTLIKLDGRWQIISKVFHFEVDPAA